MPSSETDLGKSKRVPVKQDLFTTPLTPLEQVRLKGVRCKSCGEVFLGGTRFCQHCGEDDLDTIVFSPKGKLWTYTVIGHRPPGDFKGPDPFVPFGVGMVELPEGLRILSPITGCAPEDLRIGMELELVVERLFDDVEGNEVIAYKFKPI